MQETSTGILQRVQQTWSHPQLRNQEGFEAQKNSAFQQDVCPLALQTLLCKMQVQLMRGWGGRGRNSCKPEEVLLIAAALLVSSTLRKDFATLGTKEAPQNRIIGKKTLLTTLLVVSPPISRAGNK